MAEEMAVPTNNTLNKDTTKESPSDSPLGVYASFPYSSEPFAELTDKTKGALMGLDNIASKTDVAARRLEVEDAWQACHFDRGYQHLYRRRGGGWELPGQSSGKAFNANKNNVGTYETNIYATKGGDIVVAALSREVPKIEFFPSNPDYAPDIRAAEEAENFKLIWSRNNNLRSLLVECARIFWNEDRVLLWTRYELNGQKYGFEEDDLKSPTVAEDVLDAPEAEPPTGQEGEDEFLEQEESEPDESGEQDLVEAAMSDNTEGQDTEEGIIEQSTAKKPLGREVTTAHGKLDHKVPISVDSISDMHFVQLYMDLDVSIAKAMFPWVAEKIHPGSDGTSEVELDRIARENVRQAVTGAYVTGDSLQRHVVVKYTWFRPSMFMDESVPDECKAELLETFPNGCLLVKAGAEYAFSRNESMDKHLVIGHALGGKGQNRRALGTAMISLQKRVNDWVDLMDDFFKRTVPKKWYNAEAFDMEAMKNEPNLPGSSGAFQPQPGMMSRDQYMMIEDTPQPQASLPDFIKWFCESLSEEISGALPSLFGAMAGENTVGNAVIQRDSALQRIGSPWNNIQNLFAAAAQQAVWCAADCRDGKTIRESIEGAGNVVVNTADLLSGSVLCYPESDPSFPQSSAEKEAKITSLIDASANIPELAQFLFAPQNLPTLSSILRMKDFKIPGATSITKQKAEFEILLRSGPQQNPQLLDIQKTLQNASDGMKQAMQVEQQGGPPPPPEAQGMMEQLVAHAKSLPPMVSTVPVAQDESELHVLEAAECLDWLNSSEGQKFKFGLPKQKAAFANVLLHWKEHLTMAKQIAIQNAPPPENKPPSESISLDLSKAPPSVSIQGLAKMGIKATLQDYAQHAAAVTNEAIQKHVLPDVLKPEKPKQIPPNNLNK